jgi:hypothetical protein
MRTRSFAARLARAEPRRALGPGRRRTLRRYAILRGRLAGRAASMPAPGYRHDRLELVGDGRREWLERLFDGEFERARVPARIDGP